MKMSLTQVPVPTFSEQWWPNLFLKKGRVLQQVTPEQLAVIREIYNDGRGSSEVGKDIVIYDESGSRIGRVSYNGRVWLHDVEEDVEVPQRGVLTCAERDELGWANSLRGGVW